MRTTIRGFSEELDASIHGEDQLDQSPRDFDFLEVERALGEIAGDAREDQRAELGEAVCRLFGWLIGPSVESMQPRSIGHKVLALGYVLDQGALHGRSLAEIGRLTGTNPRGILVKHAAKFARMVGHRNRAQVRAQGQSTPRPQRECDES